MTDPTGRRITSGVVVQNTGSFVRRARTLNFDGFLITDDGASVKVELTALQNKVGIVVHINGGGSAITTGKKIALAVPFDLTISGWTLLADQSGSIVIDVNHSTYSGYPTTSSAAGSEKPTLSSAQKAQDLSLTTWGETTIEEGEILEFEVDSATTVTWVTLTLFATRGI